MVKSLYMYKIEFIPSFFTKFWLFSPKSAENSKNVYLHFRTIIKNLMYVSEIYCYILEGNVVSYFFWK